MQCAFATANNNKFCTHHLQRARRAVHGRTHGWASSAPDPRQAAPDPEPLPALTAHAEAVPQDRPSERPGPHTPSSSPGLRPKTQARALERGGPQWAIQRQKKLRNVSS
jgi:hypothetical protein